MRVCMCNSVVDQRRTGSSHYAADGAHHTLRTDSSRPGCGDRRERESQREKDRWMEREEDSFRLLMLWVPLDRPKGLVRLWDASSFTAAPLVPPQIGIADT